MNIDKELLTILLGSIGGAAAVIGGLAGVLGSIITNRIHERDITRELLYQRNSDAQFNLYSSVWSGLQDLKVAADRLWERATEDTYHAFVGALFSARIAIQKGRIVMHENDYQRLNEVLNAFENFHVGKKRLIEFRNGKEFKENYRMEDENWIKNQIELNRHYKDEYGELLDKVLSGFRARIGIDS